MADDYVTDGLINPGENPPHPTCVETTTHATRAAGMRTWVHGQDCPRPAGPDPAREARIDAYRDRERRRAARALDRFLEAAVDGADLGPITAVAGERFVEQVGDYVLARIDGMLPAGFHVEINTDPIHQKADYGVCPDGCPDTVKHGFTGHHAEHARGVPGMGDWPADDV